MCFTSDSYTGRGKHPKTLILLREFFAEYHTHPKALSTYLQTFASAASDPFVSGMFIQIFIKKPMKQSINNDGYQDAA